MNGKMIKRCAMTVLLSVILTILCLFILYLLKCPEYISNIVLLKPLADIILDYLKVILTWPVSVFISILFIAYFFKAPLTKWFENLKVKYGDWQLSSELQDVKAEDTKQEMPGEVNTQEPMKSEEQSDVSAELSKNNVGDNHWRTAAYLWEYRYLNLYLVFNTKRILLWLYEINSIRLDAANGVWAPLIPSLAERESILKVLLDHHLIQLKNNNQEVGITPKGKEYVELMLKTNPLYKESIK